MHLYMHKCIHYPSATLLGLFSVLVNPVVMICCSETTLSLLVQVIGTQCQSATTKDCHDCTQCAQNLFWAEPNTFVHFCLLIYVFYNV